MTAGNETWIAGQRYEAYVGRWSRAIAKPFLDWLDMPEGCRWLDVGCGTGAMVEAILAHGAPSDVLGVDLSSDFIAHARHVVTDARATFRVGNAQDLDFDAPPFDVATAALVLNFVPRPEAAVRAMAGRLRPGGCVAAYVWDYALGMELIRLFWDAAVALDPAARALDEAVRFPICRPDALEGLFETAGLDRVEVRAIDITTRFESFDAYWQPFLGGNFPAPAYAMSLDETARSTLRERLRRTLPTAPDGSIDLVARAWAVRGIRQ